MSELENLKKEVNESIEKLSIKFDKSFEKSEVENKAVLEKLTDAVLSLTEVSIKTTLIQDEIEEHSSEISSIKEIISNQNVKIAEMKVTENNVKESFTEHKSDSKKMWGKVIFLFAVGTGSTLALLIKFIFDMAVKTN